MRQQGVSAIKTGSYRTSDINEIASTKSIAEPVQGTWTSTALTRTDYKRLRADFGKFRLNTMTLAPSSTILVRTSKGAGTSLYKRERGLILCSVT